ncbi:MAG TPA: hypothetical protein VEH04_02715 [Verrucomicrobiae bacterium]|nr:hypothetical protein [Verrucomicrobiae bacterium]
MLAAVMIVAASSLPADAQLPSSGFPVKNRKFEMLVTDYGYADLALDRRKGFKGREYLSGEWAAAVHYTGGMNPTGPKWFQPQWFFPDWVSNSDFKIQKGFNIADPFIPTNMSGFNVYSSIITNRDLRVTFLYDTIDFGTNATQQLALGLSAKSAGGIGSSLPAQRYAFRQRYEIQNLTSGTLSDVRFYQLLHALEAGNAVYDDRDYGGGMSQYRYRVVQQGKSYGFDSRTMETVEHTDTIGVSFNMMPSGYEVGYYGLKGVDSHSIGKPSAGVHLSVENDTFSSADSCNPTNAWVSGAMRFSLGSLAPNAKASITALFGIHTTYEVKYPPLNLEVRTPKMSNGQLQIDFRDTTQNPLVGYLLRKSTELGALPHKQWEPLPLPYFINVPSPGWRRFQVPVSAMESKAFYWIEPQVIND